MTQMQVQTPSVLNFSSLYLLAQTSTTTSPRMVSLAPTIHKTRISRSGSDLTSRDHPLCCASVNRDRTEHMAVQRPNNLALGFYTTNSQYTPFLAVRFGCTIQLRLFMTGLQNAPCSVVFFVFKDQLKLHTTDSRYTPSVVLFFWFYSSRH